MVSSYDAWLAQQTEDYLNGMDEEEEIEEYEERQERKAFYSQGDVDYV